MLRTIAEAAGRARAAFALLFMIQAHTGRFLAMHTAPRSDGAVAVSPPFWKAAVGVKILKSAQEGGPHRSRGARSLWLAQRIISGFVQALYFGAVEALISDLQPRAFGRL
jgi:hypothetical protein